MGNMKNKNNRRIVWVIVIGAVVLLGLGFGYIIFREEVSPPNPYNTTDHKQIIGVSFDSMVIERWQRDSDIIKTKAEELGFQVEVFNAFGNSSRQKEQIKTLISEGAAVIMIIANDKDDLREVISEAKKAGIIIISYDRLILNSDVDAYVSFDNVAVGKLMAQALVDVVPEGNYVIINGSPTDYNTYMFNEGYYEVLQPYIDSGKINIIEEVWSDNWEEDTAYDTVNQLLQEEVKIDAIIGANDRLAEGAISALSEYGLVGYIPVAGHDADISGCQRIVEGKQLMTVYKPIKRLAERAVELAVELLNKKDFEYTETISNGSYNVPYIKLDVISVNSDNMRETVIADLFHSEEDVYRNLTDETLSEVPSAEVEEITKPSTGTSE